MNTTIITNPLRVGIDINNALMASQEVSEAFGARVSPIIYNGKGDPEYPYITYARNAFRVEKEKDGSKGPVGVGVTIDVNARKYDDLPVLCDAVQKAVEDYVRSKVSPLKDWTLSVGEDSYSDQDGCYYVSLIYTFDISY